MNIRGKKELVLVTSKKFSKLRIVGDPISQAKIFESQKADELLVLFIDKNINLQNSFYSNYIQRFAKEIFMPLAVGGSVKTIKDFENLLSNGADKVVINAAFTNPNLVHDK